MVEDRGEAPLSAAEAARWTLAAVERGEGIVTALFLDGPARGRRRALSASGGAGVVGDPTLQEEVDALALEVLQGRVPAGPRGREAGTHTLADGTRVYIERTLPVPELVIVGAGHLAAPLSRVGALLGFRVIVLDDRPEFARSERFPDADRVLRVSFSNPFEAMSIHAGSHILLVTRGHRYDYECLRILLALPIPPAYIGMIGSRRRVRATFHQLKEEGVSVERMGKIRAPVGLDLGAETPEEIAIAVGGELVLARRGGSGVPLSEKERIAERFFPEGVEGRGEGE